MSNPSAEHARRRFVELGESTGLPSPDPLQRFRDEGWVQRPNGGWIRDNAPTHCWWGHPLVARSHTHGWDGARLYWYCDHVDHGDDDKSRWRFLSGPQEPAVFERGAANGEIWRARRAT